MNLKTIPICFFLNLLPLTIEGYCILTSTEFSCKQTNYSSAIQAFYEQSHKVTIASPLRVILEDSTFDQLNYFPNLPSITHYATISSLVIKNSAVEHVENNTFEELTDLRLLDLSWNKLTTVFFVQDLPHHLEVLIFNNNNISHLSDVFGRLKFLRKIDFSYNKIAVLNFANIFWVQSLNFSHNNIETINPSRKHFKIHKLDLGYNKIANFSEVELNLTFHLLHLAHNEMKTVELAQGDKEYLGLSATNINQLTVFDTVKIQEVDLSSSTMFLNFDTINIIPTQHLLLRNSKIATLNKSTLKGFINFAKIYPYELNIDLSNSSVEDISPYYFKEFQITSLNLSNNNISVLRNQVFLDSSIRILDLSNSNIGRIETSAFKNLVAEKISLKANKLEVINDVFNGVKVRELDVSFNKFKVITNHSFVNCHGLLSLNLERCLVERIEPAAFLDLGELQTLKLAYNKLVILETNSIRNLPVRALDLKGNKIDTIRSKAFNELPNLKQLNLSKMEVRNVESYAFHNLSRLETIDLSYNDITIVPHYLFVGVENLRTVHLEGNNITTLNPFSNRLKIHTLSLTFRGIFKRGQILNTNVRYLHIRDSKIDVLKSNCFEGLYNLRELKFSNSQVYVTNGALDSLFNLKFLDSQSLFKNVKGIKQHTFKDLSSLENLNLSSLSLQYLETKAFVGMLSLETLLLNDNNFTELEADTFQGLDSLKLLDLSNSNIDTCHEKSFAGLGSLEILRLENNNLATIDSPLLFGRLNNLLILHLGNNNISLLHAKSFFGPQKLLELHLQDNTINEMPIGVFQYLTTLKVLNLSNNGIKLLKTGALSNLGGLEVLDMSNNQLVNLDYVDIFFSLKQLEIVRFDGNHLKQFDFKKFLINLTKIKYVGISSNKWKCDTLSYIIESFNNRSIDYKPEKPVFDDDNIDGISCVDICKFVYCSHENVEPTLHYY